MLNRIAQKLSKNEVPQQDDLSSSAMKLRRRQPNLKKIIAVAILLIILAALLLTTLYYSSKTGSESFNDLDNRNFLHIIFSFMLKSNIILA
jgi:hypothetical protein